MLPSLSKSTVKQMVRENMRSKQNILFIYMKLCIKVYQSLKCYSKEVWPLVTHSFYQYDERSWAINVDEYNIHHNSIVLHDLVTICTDFSAFIIAAAITMCSSCYIGNLNLGGENPNVPHIVLSFRVLCIYHCVSDFPFHSTIQLNFSEIFISFMPSSIFLILATRAASPM